MTNYKEILRLHSLGINNSQIAAVLCCSQTTVITVQRRAGETGVTYQKASGMSNKDISRALFPNESSKPEHKMPDYNHIHREMAKSYEFTVLRGTLKFRAWRGLPVVRLPNG